jgi:hypothetical protein
MSLPAAIAPSQRAPRMMIVITGVTVLVLLLAGTLFLASHWPFTREEVIKSLEESTASSVEIRTFRPFYFPNPGCIAEGVVFRKGNDTGIPPFITVEKLTLSTGLLNVFRKHLGDLRAEGAHVVVPPGGKFEQTSDTGIVIDHFEGNGSIVEFISRKPGKKPLKFVFDQLALKNVSTTAPLSYQIKLQNPVPPGEIDASGQFGPLNLKNSSQTALSGDYTFRDADLGAFPGIAGKLFSQGKFHGTLGHVDIEGNTDNPAFEVTESHHAVHLGTQFQAYVNGENGDTFLNNVQSRIGKTTVYWRGKVAGTKGTPGKITSLEMSTKNGRIEDLLRMFVSADKPPMQGAISFKGTTLLPPGTAPFLKRIEIDGIFGIDAGRFTKPETQEGVNKLSENSESDEVIKAEKKAGEGKEKESDAPLALSDVKGSVVVRNGMATFTKLSFSIPSASAEMHGTYNLITQNVDLHGQLHMDSELSKTTHGFKSLLMKPLDPFFKKKHGSLIPVKVGGTFKHPTFGLEIAKKG